jgi:hypothetical protein
VFFAMTLTDGIAAPAGSVTIPVKLPMMSCATASPEHAQTAVQNKPNRISRFISDPFYYPSREGAIPYGPGSIMMTFRITQRWFLPPVVVISFAMAT